MSDTFNDDFVRLVPCNQIAHHLFLTTCIYVEENKTFYLRFLKRNNVSNEMLAASDELVKSFTDYDS